MAILATLLILVSSFAGIGFAVFLFNKIKAIEVDQGGTRKEDALGVAEEGSHDPYAVLFKCYNAIRGGANAFLIAEYTLCLGFTVVFAVLILFLTAHERAGEWNFSVGMLSAVSFAVGAITSMASGYIGTPL